MGILEKIFFRNIPRPVAVVSCDLDLSRKSLGLLALGAPSDQIMPLFGPPVSWRLMKRENYFVYPEFGFAIEAFEQKVDCLIIATREPQWDFRKYINSFSPFPGSVIIKPGLAKTAAMIDIAFVVKNLGDPFKFDEDEEEIVLTYHQSDWEGDFEFCKDKALKCLRIWRPPVQDQANLDRAKKSK